jgi:hypothetical protein
MSTKSLGTRFLYSAVSRFDLSKMPPRRLLQIAFVVLLSLVPLKASPQCNVHGDIPFRVTTNFTNDNWCFQCQGPWFRITDPIVLFKEYDECTFYAANGGIFSPAGKWTCAVIQSEIPTVDCSIVDIDNETKIVHESSFCLDVNAPPGVDIEISIISDGSFSVSGATDNCSSLVSSFLGDNSKQEKSRPDSDVFLFDGAGGDEVTLRLETNPREGNNGGDAILGISGNSLNESTSGTPPLELDVTLPADGEYSITVEQPRRPKDQRFRGSYMLSVMPTTGSIESIEPTKNVEK